ncbi:MAG: hypothetical protein KDD35_00210 [Bdellovibrionales bacterium]|nr:hypothetical protein [Bdellovibrionales bacterium]
MKLKFILIFLSSVLAILSFQNCGQNKSNDKGISVVNEAIDNDGETVLPKTDFVRDFLLKARDVQKDNDPLSYSLRGAQTLSPDGVLTVDAHFFLKDYAEPINLYQFTARFRGKGVINSNNVKKADQPYYGAEIIGSRFCKIKAVTPDGSSELIYSSDRSDFEDLPTQIFFILCYGAKVDSGQPIRIDLTSIFLKLQASEEGFEAYGVGRNSASAVYGIELVSEAKVSGATFLKPEVAWSGFGYGTFSAESELLNDKGWSWEKK